MREQLQTRLVQFRASPMVLTLAQQRAQAEQMTLSEYLRDLVRKDFREAA